MGYGDEIMAAGQAKGLFQATGKPVVITDHRGRPRWSEVWENNPYIVKAIRDIPSGVATLKSGPFCRPYYSTFDRVNGTKFTEWNVRGCPGEIYLTDDELSYSESVINEFGNFILIEPNLSNISNVNKQWGIEKWIRLAKKIGNNVLQISPPGAEGIQGVRQLRPPTFRKAAAVLKKALVSVLPEGGLHHASAAVGGKAIVIFGGHISPVTTGYDCHINVYHEIEGSPCGQWEPCVHCKKAMDMITVDEIYQNIERALNEKR